jgi:nitroreductase
MANHAAACKRPVRPVGLPTLVSHACLRHTLRKPNSWSPRLVTSHRESSERATGLESDSALYPDSVGLLEGICSTRAIRRYRDEPVPEHVLRDVLFAATRAPSGSNRQPFRFLVLTDGPKAAAAKELIAGGAQRIWGVKRTTDGYDRGSGADVRSPKAAMARTMEAYVEQFDRVPVLILPCLVRHREPHPVDGASIYPACQNLLLAARALGYGGVMTSWNLSVDAELHSLLGIPDDVFVAAAITLGRPEGHHGSVRRRPLDELVYLDEWGGAAPFAIDPPGTRYTGAGPPPRSVDGPVA